ncbi:MAG: fibrobacter succinogenes major paralogous domain-containing protein [Prevotellaceae bacterium]|jgi:uncharacterized protein (TIGR02145 family)|nr:fibrobacter succinogenes major paralogous domain-containing protein [Prevotellaceae bacterium]
MLRSHSISVKVFLAIILAVISACSYDIAEPERTPTIIGDSILIDASGCSYRLHRFGSHLWVMENYRTTHTRDSLYTFNFIKYPNNTNFEIYYTQKAALELVPKGWRVPNMSDFDTLLFYLGVNVETAGSEMKGIQGWSTPNYTSIFNLPATGYAQKKTGDDLTRIDVFNTDSIGYLWLSANGEYIYLTDTNDSLHVGYVGDSKEQYMPVRYVITKPAEINEKDVDK